MTAPLRADARLLTPAQLTQSVRRFTSSSSLWTSRVRFTTPERFSIRLAHSEAHEVWLLTWLPGQGTDIHDHGGASGAFGVVRGELTEQTFARRWEAAVPPSPRRLPTGGVRSFGPRHIHQVRNDSDSPAVSIHAYSPALATMSSYRESPGSGGVELVRTNTVDGADDFDELADAPDLDSSDDRDGQA
ncbi:cysteine dioxygenase family protein [Streptomyces tubbatahanensis]|uniref:Cysteine dioxygenase family protein n=1 Tax=Streptomyces tubbatahanensis TaxID=2923272 RepID=A0ABY3XP01_9ACTN|nr:cysteine dioxygenase family protein [Streptomyces tubbatahanensis]UNS96099.1 cysteine dioxygenase family protein [Streptomyces tubbatahanensis]